MMKRTSSGDGSKPAVDLAAYLPDAVAVFSRLGDCTAVVPTRSADSPLWLNMSAPALFEPTQVVLDTIEHAVMEQRVIVVECRRVGSGQLYSLAASPMLDGYVLVVARDITERKRDEEMLHVSQSDLVRRLAESASQTGQSNEQLAAQIAEMEQRNSEIVLMNEMVSLLQACVESVEVHGIVAKHMLKMFKSMSGMLATTRERGSLEIDTAWGDGRELHNPLFTARDCWALRSGQMHDSASGLMCSHVNKREGSTWPAMCICVPLLAQGGMMGVLNVIGESPINAAQKNLLNAVGKQIALALANLNLLRQLNDLSIRDGLTGIFNRRYLEDALDREIRRAGRNANSVSVIMLDVDHFKKFNDTYGHEAGDALLVELGALLKSFVRAEDIPCRYGGEEFTVILPGATLDVAARRAEELRIMARNTLKITHRAEKIGGVTLSLGVASFPDHALAQDALMRLADQALYQAKQAGRDRVVVAALERLDQMVNGKNLLAGSSTEAASK